MSRARLAAPRAPRSASRPPEPPPTRTQLRRELRQLAREFVERLVGALEQHGVFDEPARDDDVELSSRRVRRTQGALVEVIERIVAHLRTRKGPVAISEIATALDCPTRAIAHPLAMLVTSGRVERTGSRRGARYRLTPKAPASRRSTMPPPSTRAPSAPPPKGRRKGR